MDALVPRMLIFGHLDAAVEKCRCSKRRRIFLRCSERNGNPKQVAFEKPLRYQTATGLKETQEMRILRGETCAVGGKCGR